MTAILGLDQIKALTKSIDLVSAMEEGFIYYSNGLAVVPPVGELLFEDPPGDVHIKYGYIKDQEYYVIKIASGFYNNPQLGIASGQGLMLLFEQKTGVLKAVLLDEGYLTDIRTAAAGALVAKFFAPSPLSSIGVLGTGVQARLQLQFISKQTGCKRAWVWGRNKEKALLLKEEFEPDIEIQVASTPEEVCKTCELIVTTTPSTKPLIKRSDQLSTKLIIAVGSDTEHKQEIDSDILAEADLVVSDSIPQSESRGEVFQAVKSGALQRKEVVELGAAIQNVQLTETTYQDKVVVDLTGVAVQDIQIATAVYEGYLLNLQS